MDALAGAARRVSLTHHIHAPACRGRGIGLLGKFELTIEGV